MSNYIQLFGGLGNSQVHSGDSQTPLYLYLEVKAAKVASPDSRKPLNLNLVIDRSGSMAGQKLDYAKKALAFIVQHLQSEDRVSLVQYDNQVEILVANTAVSQKDKLLKIIDTIRHRGATNLSGGMMEGFAQARKAEDADRISRVLLLSDGLANNGITDPGKMGEIAQQVYREEGISLSTFGVGSDYDEKLMIMLAEYGGGSAHFIGLPDEIPNMFSEELQGLLAVAAQNAKVTLHYPAEVLTLEQQYGQKGQDTSGQLSIALHDLFSEDRKGTLLRFVPKQPITEPVKLSLSITYDDILGSLKRETLHQELTLTPVASTQDLSSSKNLKVLEQLALYQANEAYQRLISLMYRHQYREAKEMAQQQIQFLKTQLQHFPGSTELKEQLSAFEEMYREIDQYEEMDTEMQSLSMKHYSSRSSYILHKKSNLSASRMAMRNRELGEEEN